MYFRRLRRTRPALTCVVMVTALMEAACDFTEPIVTDVFHRKELLGWVFFFFPKVMKSENEEFLKALVDFHSAKTL